MILQTLTAALVALPAGDLPDPLIASSGDAITSARDWPARRREIETLFADNMYGPLPPRPTTLRVETLSEVADAVGGLAVRKEVRITFGDGEHADLLVYLPAAATAPSPVLLGLNFYGNHSIEADPRIGLSGRWLPARAQGVVDHRATEASRGSAAARWPIRLALERGYAVVTAYHGDFDPDRPAGHPQRDAHGSGSLSMWAWGLHRAMDALEREPRVDVQKVMVFGHSRNGKAALWAGATDHRFAVVISNQSGCCGAAISRRRRGEAIERIQRVFPHWFNDRFAQYANREDDLPVDQHQLVALLAPRPVLVCSAAEDTWADPEGEFLALLGAEPVYRLLGAGGCDAEAMPDVDTLIPSRLGYHVRAGGHAVGAADWNVFLDYGDRWLDRDRLANEGRWREPVRQCLDTLLARGTDRYGDESSPLLMAVIDVDTLASPADPRLYDALVRTEGRLHRRAERGSNLWYDQNTLRSLRRMSALTGDAKYVDAADAYVDYALARCLKPNGLLVWGTHIFWDCYEDAAAGDGDGTGPHEILIHLPDWEAMYRVNPDAVRRMTDAIWEWHVIDKETGLHNRHDDGRPGCDFAFSGGSFALAFATMYRATGEERYLDRARTVAQWHWRHRDPETGLVADAPSLGRYDGRHSFTSVTGPFASQLLRCSEITGDTSYRDMATAYIKAYERYGWDDRARTYWGMLALDGTRVPAAPRGSDYDRYQPTGPIDLWRTIMFSYEFPLVAAQASVYAYELSRGDGREGDAELLAIALHWAEVIEANLPPRTGRRWRDEVQAALPADGVTGGTYAENYGRAISFFLHLHRATGEVEHLRRAEQLADEAIAKLFTGRLFRGHPAKAYYESTDGVGLLLWALLELDAPTNDLGGAF